MAPYNADITAEVLHRQVAPHALGIGPPRPAGRRDPSARRRAQVPGLVRLPGAGGVDTALWDLRGRLEGVGVSELLGAPAGPIHAYASSMRRDIAPADEARRLAGAAGPRTASPRSRSASGGSAGTTRTSGPAAPRLSFRRCGPRSALDARLLVDANSCYTPAQAIEVGRFLEQQA